VAREGRVRAKKAVEWRVSHFFPSFFIFRPLFYDAAAEKNNVTYPSETRYVEDEKFVRIKFKHVTITLETWLKCKEGRQE
jgi:hypothetical protein